MDNRFPFTGVVTEISEMKRMTNYFVKREFKLSYSDVNSGGNIVQLNAKFAFHNDDIILADDMRIGDIVTIGFFVDGRDVTSRDGKQYNFTSLVAYEVSIVSSPSRDGSKEREAVIKPEGRDIKKEEKAVTDEQLAGIFAQDPLLQEWEQKRKTDVVEKEDDLPF